MSLTFSLSVLLIIPDGGYYTAPAAGFRGREA